MNNTKKSRTPWTIWSALAILFFLPVCTFAQTSSASGPTPVAPVANVCTPRFAAGSVIHSPPEVYSALSKLVTSLGISTLLMTVMSTGF
jgi:hypothetical protein